MDTIELGNLGVAKTIARLIELGYIVSRTEEGAPYDLVVDDKENLYRVQVKSVKNTPNVVYVDLRRISHNTKETKCKKYQKDEIDVFCIYAIDRDEIYWVPFEEAPSYGLTLRWTRPRNNQKKNIRMAKDYLI